MDKMKIMIVEDDAFLAIELKEYLSKWGYDAICADKFEDILGNFVSIGAQLILMDINLPFYDGFYWCFKIREFSKVPILFISSRNDDRDKIMAIAQGGDDYIEKPFNLPLLRAKIEAILRRTYQYKIKQKIYLKEDLLFDEEAGCLYYKKQKIEVTKSENIVLHELIENHGSIVTRDALMDALWNTNEFVSDNTLNVLMSRLRAKLKEITDVDVILTKKGQGYYIE